MNDYLEITPFAFMFFFSLFIPAIIFSFTIVFQGIFYLVKTAKNGIR